MIEHRDSSPADLPSQLAAGTMEGMRSSSLPDLSSLVRSRRTFLLGGLGFLAACSSAKVATDAAQGDGDENKLVLGGDEAPTAIPNTAEAVAEEASAPATGVPADAADVIAPTPTPDPSRSPITPVAFNYLDGVAGSLADFAGVPLVINFFASWCPPCRDELPHFEEISQKYADQVRFLGFSVTDDPETTRELLAETGVTFDVAMDPDQSIHFDLGGIAMPTTLFVDRFGNLATGRFGAIRAEDLETLILEEIL